ncbi:MAG: RdgB/HAM1 family non-canonical purine NTP pyrophosphatase [Bdellovibrionales bacterium]
MIELWIATHNKGKINEFRNLMGGAVELHTPSELGYYSSPPETGGTFEENARIKARSVKAVKPGKWVAADDSGIEVEGLGGLPGVHSARYAGNQASDAENIAKLLKMLQIRSPRNRNAQFRCVLVAYDPEGQEHVLEGVVKGQIATKVRGQTGFGYDPIFIPEGFEQTFAELGVATKNQISHRAKALRELLTRIHPQSHVNP